MRRDLLTTPVTTENIHLAYTMRSMSLIRVLRNRSVSYPWEAVEHRDDVRYNRATFSKSTDLRNSFPTPHL
jgi:hypothetical protein